MINLLRSRLDHLNNDLINIISNQRSLLPRSLIDVIVHHFDPETTFIINKTQNPRNFENKTNQN